MSPVKRWLAGAASAALLLGLAAPTTGHADDAVVPPTHHAGPCVGDTGVTTVVDFQKLGGGAEVRCFTGEPADGVEAIRGAGFTVQGVEQWGDAFICRINGRPSAQEVIALPEDPDYTEKCLRTPPASGYWSYWHSSDRGKTWEYSNLGAMGYEPGQGDWEGWSFSMNATASTNPEPRTGLALAAHDNAASTAAAAQWIAGQWDAGATQFAAGLADGISALAAAGAHPDVVAEMVEAMKAAAPRYVGQADSLAKVLIALDMTGQDTRNFLGCERDLVAELDAFIAAKDRSLDNWWGPHLVTIALNRLGKPVPQGVHDLLAKRQKADGSFGSPDDTGLALSALVGTRDNALNPRGIRDAAAVAIDRAVAWAGNPANQKTKDGNYYWATFAAANSTGILAGGLAEAGVDVSSPQAFMRGQQKLTGVGAWQNKLDATAANYMATAQGILAVAGRSYGTATLEVPRTTTECPGPLPTTTVTVTVTATAEPTPAPTVTSTVTTTATATATATATVTITPTGSATATTRPSATAPPSHPATVYNTPGYHRVNGRHWFTSCEPYSVTQRCRTLIEATTVKEVGGRFLASTGWTFNNLTYLPAPKSAWKGNPLAETGEWTTPDGRSWRTECNTAATGGNGCRSHIESRVVANLAEPGQPVRYGWVTRWEFNNMVQFS